MIRKCLYAVLACALTAQCAQAALTFVTSRASLGGTDTVDWGQLGTSFTSFSNGSALSGLGATVNFSDPANSLQRRDQDNGWNGCFAPGDRLLWNAGSGTGAILLTFAVPVNAVGAQLQNDSYGTYTGTINLYGSGMSLLGSFSLAGPASGASDNSAQFYGAVSDAADITAISFDIPGSSSFAINQVSLSPVPEPTSLAVLGLTVMGLLSRQRRSA